MAMFKIDQLVIVYYSYSTRDGTQTCVSGLTLHHYLSIQVPAILDYEYKPIVNSCVNVLKCFYKHIILPKPLSNPDLKTLNYPITKEHQNLPSRIVTSIVR